METKRFCDVKWIRKPPMPVALVGSVLGFGLAALLFTGCYVATEWFPSIREVVPLHGEHDDSSNFVRQCIRFGLVGLMVSIVVAPSLAMQAWLSRRAQPVVVRSDALEYGSTSISFAEIDRIRFGAQEAPTSHLIDSTKSDTVLIIDYGSRSLSLIALGCSVSDIAESLAPIDIVNPAATVIPFVPMN
jgi:hypothetical protein